MSMVFGKLNEMKNILTETKEIKDIEANFSCLKLLRLLRKADPEYKDPKTISYLNLLSERALSLLRMSCNYLLRGNCLRDAETSEIKLLNKLAAGEALLSVARAASGIKDDKDSINNMRQYILMQHIWKKIKEEVSIRCEGANLIPLMPEDMLSLYKEPWLRCGNSLAFFADKKISDSLVQVLEVHGFAPDKSDPLEAQRLRCISFRNKDNVVFDFYFDAPFSLSGLCGDYVKAFFKDLAEGGREISLAEYALLLAVKLHIPNMYQSSARLCDLLDFSLIINAYEDLTNKPEFREKLIELIPAKSLDMIISVCSKALTVADDVLLEEEIQYMSELIGRPYMRASFIEMLSKAFFEEGRYLDPPEFTVSKEKKLIYLVNSKVACSSIKASMLDDEVPDDYTVHRSVFMQGMTTRALAAEEQEYFKFTFVRNPFARLVSCYKSKYHTDVQRYRKRFDFRDYLNGYLYTDEGFDEFVRKVCALPYRLMDRHFRSQYDLIYNAAGTQFNYIGHFENLKDDFSTIQKKYRLRPLPHLNRVGTDDWMNYYTVETASLVYKTFKNDIEEFGYEKCYSNLLAFIQNQKS